MPLKTKKTIWRRWWFIALVTLIGLPLFKFSYFSFPSIGRVLDLKTGEPIANAIVRKEWGGSNSGIVQSFSSDHYQAAARTNRYGYYYLPGWFCFIPDILYSGNSSREYVYIYTEGYRNPTDTEERLAPFRWSDILWPNTFYFVKDYAPPATQAQIMEQKAKMYARLKEFNSKGCF